MSRIDLVNKNLPANLFSQFQQKKNDSQENFVRHSLANIARVARITNSRLRMRKAKKGLEESANFAKVAKVTFLVLLQQVSISQTFLVNQFFLLKLRKTICYQDRSWTRKILVTCLLYVKRVKRVNSYMSGHKHVVTECVYIFTFLGL